MHRKLVVALAALALVAGACGGNKGNDVKSAAGRRTTTTAAATDATLAGDATAATASTAKNGAPTTVKGAAPTTTTAKPSAATAPATTDPNAAPAPAATGTYDYAQSGSTSQGSVPPQGTLVVSGTGPSQVFRRNVDSQGDASDLYMNFRSDGPFLTKVVVHNNGATITCSFGSPVPAPPWPPTTGRSFSGHATCDNGFVADFSGSITGHGSDSVARKAYDTVIVASTLHITGNGVDVTVHDTQHWAPALRVPTYSHEAVSGTGPLGAQISGDVTSTLLNSAPH